MNPSFARAHYGLGLVYEQQGRYDEAIQTLERAVALSQESAVSLAAVGHTYALSGKRPQAEKILTRLLEMSERGQVSPYFVAMVYAGLGQKDRALVWLEKLGPKDALGLLAKDQAFDSLHGDLRFTDLTQRFTQ